MTHHTEHSDDGGLIRLDLNAMESEVIEDVLYEINAEKRYDDGLVLEPITPESKQRLVNKISEREQEYSQSNDHQAAQWCQQATSKVRRAKIEQPE